MTDHYDGVRLELHNVLDVDSGPVEVFAGWPPDMAPPRTDEWIELDGKRWVVKTVVHRPLDESIEIHALPP